MSNPHFEFTLQLTPGTLAKAEDVNSNFSSIEAGFTSVTTDMDSAIKVINSPGTVDINLNAVARANKIISFDAAGGIVASVYIGNYQGNHATVAGTVYNVRDTVKDSTGSLGQNNIYICNTSHTSTGTLLTDTANWDVLVDAAASASSAAAALVSEAAALVSENNAAASYDSFDDRYLGQKAVEPTLDNDGNALLTGALFFHTAINRMKVWNSSAWQLTTADAIDINVADTASLINAVNTEIAIQELAAASIGVTTTGTTSALVATYGLPTPIADDVYSFTSSVNVLAGATLNIDSGGAKAVVNQNGIAIILGDIVSGGKYSVRANGVTNWILMNPTRGIENLTVNTALTIGNELDLAHLAGQVPLRIGLTGLIYGNDNGSLLNIASNLYLNSGGSEVAITTNTVGSIRINSNVIDVRVAPSTVAGSAPVFKTPISIDLTSGLITVSETIGVQGIYEQPPLTTGAVNAYAADLGITSYAVGKLYKLRIHVLNTLTSTLDINNIGPQLISLINGNNLTEGDLQINQIAAFLWTGTTFILQNVLSYDGIFTPELFDDSFSSSESQTYIANGQEGFFYKKDGVCDINVSLRMLSIGTLSGNVFIGNFPFASKINTYLSYPGVIGNSSNYSVPQGSSLGCFNVSGAAYMTLYLSEATTTQTLLQISQLSSNFRVTANLRYMIA